MDQRSSVEVNKQVSGGGPSSALDALYFQLMREVVADFADRFIHPQPNSASRPPQPAAPPRP
jgi:hypothetical protein